MRICLLSQEYPPETGWGGIGTYTFELAHALVGAGHDVAVVARGERDGHVLDEGINVFRLAADLPLQRWRLIWRLGRLWPAFPFRAFGRIRTLHRANPFDVVEAAEYGADSVVLGKWRHRPPLVVRLHSPTSLLDRFRGLRPPWHHRWTYRLERTAAADADAITAPCAAILSDARGLLRAQDLRRAIVIPNAVSLPYLQGAQPDRAPGEVLFVGRLERRKGADVLERVAAMLLSEFEALQLRLIGSDTRDEYGVYWSQRIGRALPAAMASRLVFDRVDRSELPKHYARASVLVVPSPWENFPYVILEAMAFGCPVVATNVGGIGELVRHGETGLLVPPDDPSAMVSAVRSILRSPELAATLANGARRRVEERFSWEATLPLVENLYGSLGHGRR